MCMNPIEVAGSTFVLEASALPIEAVESAREVAEQIREGRALLKIVQTPWGVEFYVVSAGERS